MPAQTYMKERVLYYWLGFSCSYLFPFLYFFIKLGITRQATRIVMPTILIGIFALLKLSSDIPRWVSSWRPSFLKGIVKAIPTFLLFIVLVTLGLTLRTAIQTQMQIAFFTYFETVLVLFGGACVGKVFNALHLKYLELDLIAKGYVLGVVNK